MKNKRFAYTNIETKETYEFERTKSGTKTIRFLGYKCPNGRFLIQR